VSRETKFTERSFRSTRA